MSHLEVSVMCKRCIEERLVTNCSACIVKFKKMAKELSKEALEPQRLSEQSLQMDANKRSDRTSIASNTIKL